MMNSARISYYDREILKELRLRVETNDPHFFGQKKLKMRGKDLKAIPHVLFTMIELEVLDLSPERESCLAFRLPLVPPSIGRLINLRVLMLDTNELYSLPKEICLLQSLERISLSNNYLTSLPHGFGRLPQLRSIHASNNKFEAFPLEVCDIKVLQFLDLSDNLLMSVPDEISKLVNLRTLLLNYNKLIKLPDALCELVDLECLWLGNNRLRELPHNFGQLVRLDWGYRYTSSVLEMNPLMHPPIEICRMGPHKINEYFKDLDSVRDISTSEYEEDELHALNEDSENEDKNVNTSGQTETLGNIVEEDEEKAEL
ncbi:hypothetical protein ACF0H5_004094 [Mactra antiquata]